MKEIKETNKMEIKKTINLGYNYEKEKRESADIVLSVSGLKKQPKFIPTFDGEYYAIDCEETQIRADCPACGKKGTLTGNDGKEYSCPCCGGSWRNKAVVGTIKKWCVKKFKLVEIYLKNGLTRLNNIVLKFEQTNSKSTWYSNRVEEITLDNISTMEFKLSYEDSPYLRTHLTDNYKEALDEVKRLNKLEKEKEENVKVENERTYF